MIGQCLSNKNESATVSKSKNFCELRPCLLPIKNQKFFKIKILRHIESLNCMHEVLNINENKN